ncbi:hypothetical protein FNL56_09150 [Tardiphaga sp. vice304]|uniref:hypothetical protein n=1 Tax=Tardiphaga sp. vice304 TaxID=2592817 RepID=UPI001164BD56|nr:hypothetical protein [Tardiphaga sp. vice304]QDM26233.1 hypothetical protein FNL56_09150 [Tardiphaga sp. vice304]
MSVFPTPRLPSPAQPSALSLPQQSLVERLREAERRCIVAEQELERVSRESEAEAKIAASAIARLSAALNKQRERADEFEQIMGAMGREFAILNVTATTLAERAGVAPAELVELKRLWAKVSADPDHVEVGLHQSAPDFLVKAARTAFRKAHHPDTRPQSEKAVAEEMFKRNEAAFERLFRMRGLSP